MVKEFVTQNYLIIESNIVNNVVVWDGDTTQWTPPQGSIALVQSTTPAMIWEATVVNGIITAWNLVEEIGAGAIGFTWDGTVLTTNQPEPIIPTV
jgi:hypothetical protein